MGAVTHRFAAALSGTPGSTWLAASGDDVPGTAAYGIALLSRYPARSWQVRRLARIPFRFPYYVLRARKMIVVEESPERGARLGSTPPPVRDGGQTPCHTVPAGASGSSAVRRN